MKTRWTVALLGAASIAAAAGARQAPTAAADRDGVAFFEAKVRPVLIAECYPCHSAHTSTPKGGLRLDTRGGVLAGGAHGPAIIAGKPDASLLLRAVSYKDPALRMPPRGRLTDVEIADLAAWVRAGAPDPRTSAAPASGTHPGRVIDMARESKHWAYQPLRRPAVPTDAALGPLAAWCRTFIDRFIAAGLRQHGLTPSHVADRRTLIRRAYFDLIGLPPTPAQVSAFLADRSPNAWEKVVDGLLASPHYGERWGRHWLDLARFAESHGYEQDYDRPNAYRYRDFVIHALNEDVPYDTFVRWQLAGDEIAPDNPMALMATGFLAAGTHATQITKNQVEKERYDELDDMLNTTCVSMLGLTVGCARCHDHKYDPIPTRDYYRMLSTFTTTVRSDYDVNSDPAAYRRALAEFAKQHEPTDAPPTPTFERALISSEGVKAVRNNTQGGDFLPVTNFLKRGDPNQKGDVATQAFLTVLTHAPDGEKHWQQAPPPGWRTSYRRRALANWVTDVDEGAGALLARVIVNRVWQHHMGRGIVATPSDYGTQGDPPTNPALLEWLAASFAATDDMRPADREARRQADGETRRQGDRKRIRDCALTGGPHPPTPSPKNGRRGAVSPRPSVTHHPSSVVGHVSLADRHPLSVVGRSSSVIRHPSSVGLGWRLKALHRLIMTSAVYMQASTGDPARERIDPDNRWCWRHSRQRLEAECIRDALLAVSGRLDPTMYGPGTLDETMKRRSIYFFVKRSRLIPSMMVFDAPNALQSIGIRATTVVAPQALFLMNNEQVRACARALASRVAPGAATPPAAAVRAAYEASLSRPPSPRELADALGFLDRQIASYRAAGKDDAAQLAATDFCQVLMSLNEFMYVE